jgi:hypothetical protein
MTSPAQEDECKDGKCGPRELKLPHDEDETENPSTPSSINLLQIEKSAFQDISKMVPQFLPLHWLRFFGGSLPFFQCILPILTQVEWVP